MTAHEINQYLRGSLFIAVDFILCANNMYTPE